jgi:hypothetical protein
MPAMITNKRLAELASHVGFPVICTQREAQDMAKDLLACRKYIRTIKEENQSELAQVYSVTKWADNH